MKTTAMVFAALFLCQSLVADEVVWASGGRRVLLKDDGTWEVLTEEAPLARWPDAGVTVQAAKVEGENYLGGVKVQVRGVLVSQRPLRELWMTATALDGDGFPLVDIYIRESNVPAGDPFFFMDSSVYSVTSLEVIKSWHYQLESLSYAD